MDNNVGKIGKKSSGCGAQWYIDWLHIKPGGVVALICHVFE